MTGSLEPGSGSWKFFLQPIILLPLDVTKYEWMNTRAIPKEVKVLRPQILGISGSYLTKHPSTVIFLQDLHANCQARMDCR